MADERDILVGILLETIRNLQVPPAVHSRWQRLMDRHDDKLLTPKEIEELDGFSDLFAALETLRDLNRRISDLTAME